jgi:hypothetical protein
MKTLLCSQGFSLNPLKMETSYGLIAGSDAAVPGVTAKNARYLLYLIKYV